MKTKHYRFDDQKHDVNKLTRAFYRQVKKNGVMVETEVLNPRPVVKMIKAEGELTVDERIRKQIHIMLMKERMRAEMNSVEPIENPLIFDEEDFKRAELYDIPTIAELSGSPEVQDLMDTTREDDHGIKVTLKKDDEAAPTPPAEESEAPSKKEQTG